MGSKASPWQQKNEEHEEQGEESWLVSYADMVTLLFGFFVILYSLSNMDDKKFDQMSEQLASAFKAPGEGDQKEKTKGISDEARQLRALQLLVSTLNLGDSMDDAVKNIEDKFTSRTSSDAVKDFILERVGKDQSGMFDELQQAPKTKEGEFVDLILPDTSLFAAGSHVLTKEAEKKLQKLAGELKLLTGLVSLEVVGHTDSTRPSAVASYRNNFTLSSLRAGSVAEALIKSGMEEKYLSVRGMGSLEPLVPEFDENHKLIPGNAAKNRRVHIILKTSAHARIESH